MLVIYGFNFQASHPWDFPRKSTAFDAKIGDLAVIGNEMNWNGRVATFLYVEEGQTLTHSEIQKVNEELLRGHGNNYSDAGMWIKNIPTLSEYNPSLTPNTFYFFKRAIGKPGDKYHRNIMYFRSINWNFLQMIGVRYLVTDEQIPLRRAVSIVETESRRLYLYEVVDSNLHGVSVSSLMKLKTLESIAKEVSSKDYDPRIQSYTLEQNLPKRFSISRNRILTVGSYGYRFRAESKGESLILLPIEFSNCFEYKTTSKNFKFIRVNGFMLGLTFEGRIDVMMKYKYGPFSNPLCRFMDYLEFKQGLSRG